MLSSKQLRPTDGEYFGGNKEVKLDYVPDINQ